MAKRRSILYSTANPPKFGDMVRVLDLEATGDDKGQPLLVVRVDPDDYTCLCVNETKSTEGWYDYSNLFPARATKAQLAALNPPALPITPKEAKVTAFLKTDDDIFGCSRLELCKLLAILDPDSFNAERMITALDA